MSKRSDKEFLRDIIEAVNRIEKYTRHIDYKQFLRDTKTQDAAKSGINTQRT